MMNNIKMMNDMELDMVVGGEAYPHGGGASGSWDDDFTIRAHGGGVSGGWVPVETTPEPESPTNVVEKETEVIIVVVDNTHHHRPKHHHCRF